jgi:methylmalonyl-CoA/ethylmalonyl-CoA epimerase
MTQEALDGVHHIAVIVRDIDRALPFYLERLNLTLLSDERIPQVGARLAFLDAGNMLLQLVEPTHPGPLRDDLDRYGEGLHHVCFAVPNIEEAVKRLAPGADVKIARGGRGLTAFLPLGDSGLRTELLQVATTDGGT